MLFIHKYAHRDGRVQFPIAFLVKPHYNRFYHRPIVTVSATATATGATLVNHTSPVTVPSSARSNVTAAVTFVVCHRQLNCLCPSLVVVHHRSLPRTSNQLLFTFYAAAYARSVRPPLAAASRARRLFVVLMRHPRSWQLFMPQNIPVHSKVLYTRSSAPLCCHMPLAETPPRARAPSFRCALRRRPETCRRHACIATRISSSPNA